jgi:hypothetical protein
MLPTPLKYMVAVVLVLLVLPLKVVAGVVVVAIQKPQTFPYCLLLLLR